MLIPFLLALLSAPMAEAGQDSFNLETKCLVTHGEVETGLVPCRLTVQSAPGGRTMVLFTLAPQLSYGFVGPAFIGKKMVITSLIATSSRNPSGMSVDTDQVGTCDFDEQAMACGTFISVTGDMVVLVASMRE